MSLADYRSLGPSGLAVSPLCLGTMSFDPAFGGDPDVSRRILDHYLALGGNFIDSANIYGRGAAEAMLGEHLGKHSGRRQHVVIATKFSASLDPGDPNSGGAGRGAIIRACEASLRRLRTDYIDLYWQHWEDPFVPIEETLRALDDLVTAGKVRYIGFSDTSAWRAAKAQQIALVRGWTPLIALQFEYSLAERTAEAELVPMADHYGLGITPWGPLRGGMLTGKYDRGHRQSESPARRSRVANDATDAMFRIVDTVRSVAADLACTPGGSVALAWLSSRPNVTSPVIGPRTMKQLDEYLASLELQIPPDSLQALDTATKPALAFPAGFLQRVQPLSYAGTRLNGTDFLVDQPGQ